MRRVLVLIEFIVLMLMICVDMDKLTIKQSLCWITILIGTLIAMYYTIRGMQIPEDESVKM